MLETKHCNGCGQDKPLSEFNIRKSGRRMGKPRARCRVCSYKRQIEYLHKTGKKRSIEDAKETSSYLGVFIAEKVLSSYFNQMERMPYGNPGYDFICGRGFKIDVKSSCLFPREMRSDQWRFTIKQNQIADYFLLLGFDNRASLNPMRVWLVPADVVRLRHILRITNCPKTLIRWSYYERPIEKIIICCNSIREKATP
jgi:hypothetical protein